MNETLSIDFIGYWLIAGTEKPSQFRRRMDLAGIPQSQWAIRCMFGVKQRLRWVYL